MRIPLSLAALALLSTALFGQTTTTIGGVVSDKQGAAIAGAKVVATKLDTGVAVPTTTNTSGNFLLTNLEIGTYSVAVEHEGFRRYMQSGIVLSTAENLALNVTLEIGQVTETMDVSAQAAVLEERTSVIGQTINTRDIEDLPLGNRRTMNVINLSPAAVFVGYDSGQKPNFSLAGGRTQSQMFWIDGGSGQNMRLGAGQVDIDPPAESVQEIQVLSNNYSAEYGGSAGGVIVETTKSGANQFHGSVYEFFRNNAMDAPGYFAQVINGAKASAELRYNIFGGTFGGPVRHNKTFFFFSTEGHRQRIGGVTTLTVPTALQRQGDFSQTFTTAGALIPIYDPQTTAVVAGKTVRTMFPGNVIPTSELDPIALKIMNFYPLPNRAPDNRSGANNFRANNVLGLNRELLHGQGGPQLQREKPADWCATSSISATTMFRAPIRSRPPTRPATFSPISSTTTRTWFTSFRPPSWTISASTTATASAHSTTLGVGSNAVQSLGLAGVSPNAFPQIVASGFATLGSNAQERRQYPIQNLQFVNDLSWIIGKHALKFGVEARQSSNYETNLSTASGAFTFATQPTGLPGSAGTGNGLASLLVGFPTAFAESSTAVIDRPSWYLAGIRAGRFDRLLLT